MKTFEEELYQGVSEVFPSTTVRSFSKALGMSEGYWSSIVTQGLRVSNAALIHLNDYLEARIILLGSDGNKLNRARSIQKLIAREIVKRFAREVEFIEEAWLEVSCVAREHEDMAGSCGAMPFVMIRG